MVISLAAGCAAMRSSNDWRNRLKIDTFWNLIREIDVQLSFKEIIVLEQETNCFNLFSNLKCQKYTSFFFVVICVEKFLTPTVQKVTQLDYIKWYA